MGNGNAIAMRADGTGTMNRLATAVLLGLSLAVVGACTSTTPPEALQSAAAVPEAAGDISEPDATEEGGAETATALAAEPEGANEAGNQVAALATTAKISLAPVIGAPSGAVRAMSQRISTRSAERGIAVLAPGASGATHDMKGYFSAITESGKTTVIYVWDIFDARGNRLHRIQGQESAPGTSPDGWSSVSSRMMETIGVRTVDEFAAWLESSKRG